jgi:tetratricopeptide (TPR) repeat protein
VARAFLTKHLGPPGALQAPSMDGAGEAFLRRAEEAFERARALSPLDGTYVRDLAWLYQLRASHPRRPGVGDPDLVRSLALYTEASRLQPTDARILVEWGWSHVLLGQLDDAYERYRRALGLDPERAETHHALWRLHLARAEAATSDTSRRAELGQAGAARRTWEELRSRPVAARPPPRCPAAS